jgi:flagellar basal body-associated protein FliL
MALWSDEDVRVQGLRERAAAARRGSGLTKALALVALLLALVLVAGSVYGLAAGTRQKKLAKEADSAQVAAELRGRASYTAIGTVRAKSADPKESAIVVATIAFPYDAADKSFAEELGRKAPVLRAAALELLSTKKASELAPAFEGSLKAALRDAFNARLSLGKVTEVWLSDFAVIR